jgi:hypothetical protein
VHVLTPLLQVGLPVVCVPFIATQVSLGLSLVYAGVSPTVLNYNSPDLQQATQEAVGCVNDVRTQGG